MREGNAGSFCTFSRWRLAIHAFFSRHLGNVPNYRHSMRASISAAGIGHF